MMENKLDGNAAAGTLQEIFPFEMTLVQVTCTGCGTTNAIGALAVYMHGMGTIVRCPVCDTVLIRVAQQRDATGWICGVCVSSRSARRPRLSSWFLCLVVKSAKVGFLHTFGEARTVERRRITYASNESSGSTGY